MKRKERAARMVEFFSEEVPVAKTMGMKLRFTGEYEAEVAMDYHSGFDNGHHGIHGGVYMAIMDSAAWFASAVTRGEDCRIATSEMAVHFLGPASGGLRARARILKSGRRQDVVEVMLYDYGGNTVGHAVGTFIILPAKSPPVVE